MGAWTWCLESVNIFWIKTFLAPILFGTQIFQNQHFSDQKYFWTKDPTFFWAILFGTNKSFLTHIFSDPAFYRPKICRINFILPPLLFFKQNIFWAKKFQQPNIKNFLTQNIFNLKFFWTQNLSDPIDLSVEPNSFNPNLFFYPQFFYQIKLFGPKIFFLSKSFFNPIFFRCNIFLDPKL